MPGETPIFIIYCLTGFLVLCFAVMLAVLIWDNWNRIVYRYSLWQFKRKRTRVK